MKGVMLALALLASATDREPEPGLTVRILDPVPGEGRVVAALFGSPETFDARSGPLRSALLPAAGETLEWRLDDLPPGVYAAVVYQDLDGDGALDRGRLGIPREPYGFSNGARAAFGPPSFDQARFTYGGGCAAVEVRLKRRPGGGRKSGE